MKIPNKKFITIAGRKFRLRNGIKPEEMKRLTGLDPAPYGALNYSERVLAAQYHKNKEEQLVTYIHEIVHCALFHSGLSQIINQDTQEIICESVANAVVDAFK